MNGVEKELAILVANLLEIIRAEHLQVHTDLQKLQLSSNKNSLEYKIKLNECNIKIAHLEKIARQALQVIKTGTNKILINAQPLSRN